MIDWEKVDWNRPDAEIARELGVSPPLVWYHRGRVGARKVKVAAKMGHISIRVDSGVKARLEGAAALAGESLGAYVVAAALARAQGKGGR